MIAEKQRIAIATACGWTADSWCLTPSGWVFADAAPDYLNDLNACHEMEKVLDIVVERGDYWDYLSSITGGEVEMIYATAAEKCEAFLRTLGLWEEQQ